MIWWEESVAVEARYATLFLDEPAGSEGSLNVYEMPSLIGGSTQSSYDGEPPGAYLYPALQVDGFSGGVLASFADLNDKQEKVVRIKEHDHRCLHLAEPDVAARADRDSFRRTHETRAAHRRDGHFRSVVHNYDLGRDSWGQRAFNRLEQLRPGVPVPSRDHDRDPMVRVSRRVAQRRRSVAGCRVDQP